MDCSPSGCKELNTTCICSAEVQLIYNVVLISSVEQSDSFIHIYTFFLKSLFHDDLSYNIDHSSLYAL